MLMGTNHIYLRPLECIVFELFPRSLVFTSRFRSVRQEIYHVQISRAFSRESHKINPEDHS